jgi:hypothetical protein
VSADSNELELERTVSNSQSLRYVPGSDQESLTRDAGLIIRPIRGEEHFEVVGYGPLFPPQRMWSAEIPVTSADVFRHVQECRKAWHDLVIERKEASPAPDGGTRNDFPFQDTWNHASKERARLHQIGAPLAVTGATLFFFLFQQGDDALTWVADRLRREASTRSLVVTVTSDTFFVPWGLLYTHPDPDELLAPDGGNFRWEGFWGYRHLIEHNTRDIDLEQVLRPAEGGKLLASVNVDEQLDAELGVPCIAPQLAFFKQSDALTVVERRTRSELQLALSADAFDDRIVYFCCHGYGAGDLGNPNMAAASIALTDRVPITADNISYWRRGRVLASHPSVIVNACQGGQLTTLLYKTLANEFLRQGATGVIGAQIDILAIFATEYARRFFSLFLDSRPGRRRRVGEVMQCLAQDFVTGHQNPLGLVYSLYRGADCHVDGQLSPSS